jgi:hypothetical protein
MGAEKASLREMKITKAKIEALDFHFFLLNCLLGGLSKLPSFFFVQSYALTKIE